MKKKLILMSTALILLLSACGNNNAQSSAANESTVETSVAQTTTEAKELTASDSIVYGLSTSPSGVFNPLLTDSVYDDAVCSMVYSSLLKLNDKQELVHSMAKEYRISDDLKTITFILNDNLKWSDGESLTADDVVFTFNSLKDEKYPGEYGNYVTHMESAQALDTNTVEVKFDEPYAPALTNLGTLGIIPMHIWKDVEVDQWAQSQELMSKPVGSGPYILTSFTEGQDVQFEKNPNFFEEVKTPKVIFKIVNEDTLVSDLKNGEVDIANVSNLKSADLNDLSSGGFKLYKHANNLFQYMGMNYRNDIFKDRNVREAIIRAIDRKGMVENLIEGNGSVTNIPMLSSSWAYPTDLSGINTYDYDVEESKKLLEAAGYSMVDDVMTSADGKKLEFTLDVPLGNSTREQAAQVIQDNLGEVGIKVELNKMEFPALMEKVVQNHDFDLYMMGNNLSVDPDLTPYWSSEAVSNVPGEMKWNIAGFSSPELDELLKEGISSYDIETRKTAYKKIAEYMNKEIPWAYLFEQGIIIAANEKLEGFSPSVFRDFSDAQNWILYK